MRRTLALLVLAVLAAAPSAHAGLILNGSFESGNYTGGSSFQTLVATDSSIAGWTITSGTVDWINQYWTAAEGTKSIDLNGTSAGAMTIASGFATVPGQQYLLTFYIAGNPDSGPTVKTLDVMIDNQPYAFSFNTAGKTRANMGWEQRSLLFTAQDAATMLAFTSTTLDNGPFYGPALDNVDVTPVPEPASLLLLGTGLLGIGRAWRKRRG